MWTGRKRRGVAFGQGWKEPVNALFDRTRSLRLILVPTSIAGRLFQVSLNQVLETLLSVLMKGPNDCLLVALYFSSPGSMLHPASEDRQTEKLV